MYKYVRLSYLHLYMRKKCVVSLACFPSRLFFFFFFNTGSKQNGDDAHLTLLHEALKKICAHLPHGVCFFHHYARLPFHLSRRSEAAKTKGKRKGGDLQVACLARCATVCIFVPSMKKKKIKCCTTVQRRWQREGATTNASTKDIYTRPPEF